MSLKIIMYKGPKNSIFRKKTMEEKLHKIIQSWEPKLARENILNDNDEANNYLAIPVTTIKGQG